MINSLIALQSRLNRKKTRNNPIAASITSEPNISCSLHSISFTKGAKEWTRADRPEAAILPAFFRVRFHPADCRREDEGQFVFQWFHAYLAWLNHNETP